jgi:hypothetical protein
MAWKDVPGGTRAIFYVSVLVGVALLLIVILLWLAFRGAPAWGAMTLAWASVQECSLSGG